MTYDMTYDMYRYVFLGALAACGVFLAISIILFFTLRIPKVISDLSGRTARKAIENIRLQNEQSGDKTYKSSAVNLQRGKLTDKISGSGRLIPRNATPFGTGVITEKISTQQLDVAEDVGETTLLSQTEGASAQNSDTGETELLDTSARQLFVIEHEITFLHTDEVIVQEGAL